MLRCLSLSMLLAVGTISFAANWPQFRGENGSGVTSDTKLPVTWSNTQNVLWKSEIPGRGVSSPVVAGDHIYVTSNSGIRQDRLHVLCYSLSDGKLLWQRQLTATGNTGCHPVTTMAAPTPVATSEGVYALFATGDLAAFDQEGTLKWYRSLVGDYPTLGNQVGMASSPILWKDYLIVPMDNPGDSFLAAIDVQYGKNVWKIPRSREANWVTPTLRVNGDKTELLFQNRTALTSYDVGTGKKNWSFATEGGSIATSVVAEDKILVPGQGGVICIQPEGEKVNTIWKSVKLGSGSASPIYFKNRVYNLSSAALNCADMKTGEVLWQERVKGRFWASPIIGDGKAYLFNDEGVSTVIEIGDEAKIIATNTLTDEKILGTPAVADSTFIIRTDKMLYRIGTK